MPWVALVPASALATPSAHLVYSRAAGAESCADEQALRAAVAKRVGYDPFFPWAKQTVVATMERALDRGFVARVFLVDERGIRFGTREFHVEGECAELLDAAALAIAIAIDPQILAGPPDTQPAPPADPSPTIQPPRDAERSPSAASPPPADGVAPPPRSASTASGVRVSATAGIVGSVGVAPAPTVGAALGGGLRWRDASLSLEGRFDGASSAAAQGGGRVSSSLVLLTLAPCAHARSVFGCLLVQGGQLRATGDASDGTTEKSAAWWAAGARFGVAVPLGGGRTSLRVHTDVLVNLAPQTFEFNQLPAWTAPALAASLGVDVVLHFF